MNAASPLLFAIPATVQAIERARAVVVLIGSYDGSGNYGDIVQFDAALSLVERLDPGIVALPVLERQYLAGHRLLNGGLDGRRPHALFFDPDGEGEDDLLPVAAPAELAFGATYLYGGGYLNRLWGGRKLAMLEAAETLLATGGAAVSCRLSSGLQVEPGWVAELAPNGAAGIGHLSVLGVRDSRSQRALAAVAGQSAPTLNTGDDAIGPLGRLPARDGPLPDDGRLHLNLHFAEHDWVTERPQAVLGFYAGFVAELGRLANRPVVAQPLIAYLDGRIDERAAVERLAGACAAIGVEVAEPLVLRPAGLAEAAPRLRAASMTLSCSYHVALTSLMLGVPAVLIGDNTYYEQKAAGLREDFGLPPAFTASATADPTVRAAEVAAALLDEERGKELRGSMAAGAERLRQRRGAAEVELLGRLGGAAAAALGKRAEELAGRVRQLAAEPGELHTRLATFRSEAEKLRLLVEESPLEAELRVQEAEARAAAAQDTLAAVLQSRSWRLLAPLRRLKARLRPS
jgi:hypothetical protein